MRPRVRQARWAAAVALPLVLLAGCGGDDPDEPVPTSEPTSEPTQEPTDEPTEEPTEEPTSDPTEEPTAEPTEQPTTEPTEKPTTPPTGLASALLTQDTLPSPGGISWGPGTVRRGTGPSDISVCQRPRVNLRSIGATKGALLQVRQGSVTARHVVARFADERSATLGYEVLEAWLGQCEEHAGSRGFDTVKAPAGYTRARGGDTAGWALVSYGPVPSDPDAAYIEPQALVRVGETISWVVWKQIGQDYNYDKGQSPPELAIPRMVQALPAS
jgi:hypothetical protein